MPSNYSDERVHMTSQLLTMQLSTTLIFSQPTELTPVKVMLRVLIVLMKMSTVIKQLNQINFQNRVTNVLENLIVQPHDAQLIKLHDQKRPQLMKDLQFLTVEEQDGYAIGATSFQRQLIINIFAQHWPKKDEVNNYWVCVASKTILR